MGQANFIISSQVKRVFSSGKKTIDFERMKRVIQAELEVRNECGANMPEYSKISEVDLFRLSEMSSRQRKREYAFIRVKQSKESAAITKKEIRHGLNEEIHHDILAKQAENKHIVYGLGHNSLLMRIRRETINKWKHHKIFRVNKFDPRHIIIDCSYQLDRNEKNKHVAHQIQNCFNFNRDQKLPFWINLTNFNANSEFGETLKKIMPKLGKPSLPITVRSEAPVDLFPKQRLVLVSPYAKQELTRLETDDIVILNSTTSKTFFPKALQANIKSVSLPIEKYVIQPKSRILSIEQMFKILYDFRVTGDWKFAMKRVPLRKN